MTNHQTEFERYRFRKWLDINHPTIANQYREYGLEVATLPHWLKATYPEIFAGYFGEKEV